MRRQVASFICFPPKGLWEERRRGKLVPGFVVRGGRGEVEQGNERGGVGRCVVERKR